jgi:hypothetical protein
MEKEKYIDHPGARNLVRYQVRCTVYPLPNICISHSRISNHANKYDNLKEKEKT